MATSQLAPHSPASGGAPGASPGVPLPRRGNASRRGHGLPFGPAGLGHIGDLLLPPGAGPDSPLQVRPRPAVGPGRGGAGAKGQAGSGCSHGGLPPQGLSPLEEAGGRPVAVAARRPDRLQGECAGRAGPGRFSRGARGAPHSSAPSGLFPPLRNVNSRTARGWAQCRSVSRRTINAGWRSDHLGLLLPSLHGEIIFHSQQN